MPRRLPLQQRGVRLLALSLKCDEMRSLVSVIGVTVGRVCRPSPGQVFRHTRVTKYRVRRAMRVGVHRRHTKTIGCPGQHPIIATMRALKILTSGRGDSNGQKRARAPTTPVRVTCCAGSLVDCAILGETQIVCSVPPTRRHLQVGSRECVMLRCAVQRCAHPPSPPCRSATTLRPLQRS